MRTDRNIKKKKEDMSVILCQGARSWERNQPEVEKFGTGLI